MKKEACSLLFLYREVYSIDYEFGPSCIFVAADSVISSWLELPAVVAANSLAFWEITAESFFELFVDEVLPEEACAPLDDAAAAWTETLPGLIELTPISVNSSLLLEGIAGSYCVPAYNLISTGECRT